MNVKLPPAQARNFGPAPDEMDRLLYAFMREEMPDPWPMMKAPAQPAPAPLPMKSRGWPRLSGSRFALAATVTLCLVGSLLLIHLFPGDSSRGMERTATENIGPKFNISPQGHGWKLSKEKTPGGRTVKVWEKGNLEKGFTIRLEPEPEE
jgi:hypothetical protein